VRAKFKQKKLFGLKSKKKKKLSKSQLKLLWKIFFLDVFPAKKTTTEIKGYKYQTSVYLLTTDTPTPPSPGHLAGHQAAVAPPTQGPTLRWTGPLADTVPAGVNGLPTQVQDTPAVAAAKRAHFAALGHAYRLTPRAF